MQNILVFGATGAMGEAIARQLTNDGASVFLAGRDEGALKKLASEIEAPFATFDAMDEASVRSNSLKVRVCVQLAVPGAMFKGLGPLRM